MLKVSQLEKSALDSFPFLTLIWLSDYNQTDHETIFNKIIFNYHIYPPIHHSQSIVLKIIRQGTRRKNAPSKRDAKAKSRPFLARFGVQADTSAPWDGLQALNSSAHQNGSDSCDQERGHRYVRWRALQNTFSLQNQARGKNAVWAVARLPIDHFWQAERRFWTRPRQASFLSLAWLNYDNHGRSRERLAFKAEHKPNL